MRRTARGCNYVSVAGAKEQPDFKKLAADPGLAEANLERFLEDTGGRKAWDRASTAARQHVLRVFGYAQPLARHLIRHPESIRLLEDSRFLTALRSESDYTSALPATVRSAAQGQTDPLALFRFKYDELLRITVKDLAEIGAYENVLLELSTLADTVLGSVLDSARPAAPERAKTLPRMVLIAQGKLGSQELNFSSDVDVQFIYSGAEDRAAPSPELQETATRWARSFMERIQENSDEGFLYRVDLALRPEGASGPLVNSLYAAELYYETWGLPWERYALLRARPCAGDRTLGEAFQGTVEPFVYRKYLSLNDVQSVKNMKDEQARQREQPGRWNVKVGVGGIRDIEFFIQGHQLLNGGKKPVLKTTSTLRALDALAREKFISPGERNQIREAYLFLRRLENHLQMREEQQTQTLAADRADRAALARSLGYGARKGSTDAEVLADFEEDLQLYTTVSREAFDRFLGEFTAGET